MNKVKFSIIALCTVAACSSFLKADWIEDENIRVALKINKNAPQHEVIQRIQELESYENFVIQLRKIFGTADLNEIFNKINNQKPSLVMTPEQQRFILEVSRLLGTSNLATGIEVVKELKESQKDIKNQTATRTSLEREVANLKSENNSMKQALVNLNHELDRVKRNTASQSDVNAAEAKTQNLKDRVKGLVKQLNDLVQR